MPIAESQIVDIRPGEGSPVDGTLHRIRFTSGDRAMNAAKMLGLCWLIALITVFIPIAHFILVPSFLIAGPVMAFLRYRATSACKKITTRCPACNQEVDISLEANTKLPLYTYCPACDASLKIEEK